jgi:hypothetical protein
MTCALDLEAELAAARAETQSVRDKLHAAIRKGMQIERERGALRQQLAQLAAARQPPGSLADPDPAPATAGGEGGSRTRELLAAACLLIPGCMVCWGQLLGSTAAAAAHSRAAEGGPTPAAAPAWPALLRPSGCQRVPRP